MSFSQGSVVVLEGDCDVLVLQQVLDDPEVQVVDLSGHTVTAKAGEAVQLTRSGVELRNGTIEGGGQSIGCETGEHSTTTVYVGAVQDVVLRQLTVRDTGTCEYCLIDNDCCHFDFCLTSLSLPLRPAFPSCIIADESCIMINGSIGVSVVDCEVRSARADGLVVRTGASVTVEGGKYMGNKKTSGNGHIPIHQRIL